MRRSRAAATVHDFNRIIRNVPITAMWLLVEIESEAMIWVLIEYFIC